MKTTSEFLYLYDTPLGWWEMWCNDVMAKLERLKLTEPRKINVRQEPTSYHLERDGWYCDHVSTHYETSEVTDAYKEVVTGEPQPTQYYSYEVCDNCHEVLS